MRRLNADGLWLVKNAPKHAHLLPLRKSKDMAAAMVEKEEDDDADGQIGQSA
jgi:hypothetical protein